jgi:hypothetical protein
MMESLPERKQDKDTKTQFILTGFSQTAGIRTYAFEGIGDRGRADYTVEVDLALIPGYGIRIQDLPLLCRELLQQRVEPDEISALTFTDSASYSPILLGSARPAGPPRKPVPSRK